MCSKMCQNVPEYYHMTNRDEQNTHTSSDLPPPLPLMIQFTEGQPSSSSGEGPLATLSPSSSPQTSKYWEQGHLRKGTGEMEKGGKDKVRTERERGKKEERRMVVGNWNESIVR